METQKKVSLPRYPKIIGDLLHSNQYLKIFAVVSLGALVISLILLAVSLTREPVILAFSPGGELLRQEHFPNPKDEVRAAVSSYLSLRYKWEPETVQKQLLSAEVFVHPTSLKAYRTAAANIQKFSSEKSVTQRVYPAKIDVNLESQKVQITGDRVTYIQGLGAAGELKVELSFESGPRTVKNPWGLYIIKEREG